MSPTIQRPAPDEYATWAADYTRRVGEGDILDILARQPGELEQILGALSDQDGLFRFAPNEWSIKEVVGHLCDVERVFYYRALSFSRGERAALPGFNQEDYVRETRFDEYELAGLLKEFRLIRESNLLSIRHFSAATSLKRGTASGSTFSVRALLYMMAGHVYHHLDSLQTNYLDGLKR